MGEDHRSTSAALWAMCTGGGWMDCKSTEFNGNVHEIKNKSKSKRTKQDTHKRPLFLAEAFPREDSRPWEASFMHWLKFLYYFIEVCNVPLFIFVIRYIYCYVWTRSNDNSHSCDVRLPKSSKILFEVVTRIYIKN